MYSHRSRDSGDRGGRHGSSSQGSYLKAQRYEWGSIRKVATGKRAVTPALALQVTRFAGIPMDELLAEQWLSARVYRDHPPDNFVDEETVIE